MTDRVLNQTSSSWCLCVTTSRLKVGDTRSWLDCFRTLCAEATAMLLVGGDTRAIHLCGARLCQLFHWKVPVGRDSVERATTKGTTAGGVVTLSASIMLFATRGDVGTNYKSTSARPRCIDERRPAGDTAPTRHFIGRNSNDEHDGCKCRDISGSIETLCLLHAQPVVDQGWSPAPHHMCEKTRARQRGARTVATCWLATGIPRSETRNS